MKENSIWREKKLFVYLLNADDNISSRVQQKSNFVHV